MTTLYFKLLFKTSKGQSFTDMVKESLDLMEPFLIKLSLAQFGREDVSFSCSVETDLEIAGPREAEIYLLSLVGDSPILCGIWINEELTDFSVKQRSKGTNPITQGYQKLNREV